MAVACARGLRGGPDPVSHRLVPKPIALTMRAVLPNPILGMVEHISRRTRAIDTVVRDHPTPQLVILGAGLDARAYRLSELEDTAVFEVDHPSTQRYKRKRATGLTLRARSLTYVAVDFERDDLATKLAESGHDTTKPTMWIWEGVTMYLSVDAVRASLAIIAKLSAKGSTIALTYVTPDLASNALRFPSLRVLFRPTLTLIGEPLDYLAYPDDIAAVVRDAGFEIESNQGPLGTFAEHLLVATR